MKEVSFKMLAEREAEMYIYDVIGDDYFGGISAKNFSSQLDALGPLDKITVRINSPGGSIYDGTAIYNALVRHPAKVVCEIDGIAASAASFIAMAGDEINIASNGFVMIHQAQGACMGDAEDMTKLAEVLTKMDGQIAATYAKRTNRRPETFLKAMHEETWYTAEEAVANRLCDSIREAKKPVAQFSGEILNRISKRPEKFAAFLEAAPAQHEEPPEIVKPVAAIDVPAKLAEYQAVVAGL